MTASIGGWIDRRDHHDCGDDRPPPHTPRGLWRCDCGRLWEVRTTITGSTTWYRPGLVTRFRYWGLPGKPEPRPKPPHPPAGESGISRSPDGSR